VSHSTTCAACGEPIGAFHIDAEELTGIRKTHDVEKIDRTHGLAIRETGLKVTYSWEKPVQHLFTLCETCVRARARECEAARLRSGIKPAPAAKQGGLAASLLVVPGVLLVITYFVWSLETRWIRWVVLAAIPVWIALVLMGDRGIDADTASHAAAEAGVASKLEALATLSWAELLERPDTKSDLRFLRETVAAARRKIEGGELIGPLDHAAINVAACPKDVIERKS
jgi:hypothetical protein